MRLIIFDDIKNPSFNLSGEWKNIISYRTMSQQDIVIYVSYSDGVFWFVKNRILNVPDVKFPLRDLPAHLSVAAKWYQKNVNPMPRVKRLQWVSRQQTPTSTSNR